MLIRGVFRLVQQLQDAGGEFGAAQVAGQDTPASAGGDGGEDAAQVGDGDRGLGVQAAVEDVASEWRAMGRSSA